MSQQIESSSGENVDPNVVLGSDHIWKRIPGYSNYVASDQGDIALLTSDKFHKLPQYEAPTSVGTYLNAHPKDDEGKKQRIGAHRLVCLAFHGYPPDDGKKYEVNHKDGNKHNNVPSNLEWMTRGDNIHHAYESGMRADAIPINVIDHVTGETIQYPTIAAVGRAFGIDKSEAYRLVSQSRDEFYQDRYQFQRDYSQHRSKNHAWTRELIAWDVVNNQLYIACDSGQMEHLTGIHRVTILWHLRDGQDKLCCGFVFRYKDDTRAWPHYTVDQAQQSRDAYHNKPKSRDRKYGIVVYDYVTDEKSYYDTIIGAEKALGLSKGTIGYLLNRDVLRLFRGKIFLYQDDEREFPECSDEAVQMSLVKNKPELPCLRVTDLQRDTTELYPSRTAFAQHLGIKLPNINVWFRNTKGKGKPFRNRYWMEEVDL